MELPQKNIKADKQTVTYIILAILAIIIVIVLFLHSHRDLRGGSGQCNDNYVGACVPNVNYDIDCNAVGKPVRVVNKDVYHFDADRDGIGCESYGR